VSGPGAVVQQDQNRGRAQVVGAAHVEPVPRPLKRRTDAVEVDCGADSGRDGCPRGRRVALPDQIPVGSVAVRRHGSGWDEVRPEINCANRTGWSPCTE
jgi:hypothetical protein